MTSLAFGTSGLRGLVVDLVGDPACRWTAAFLSHLEESGWTGERVLLVGRDLRSSSPEIAGNCLSGALERGWRALDCGDLPTPALALAALARNAAAVMVTGSHIPDDRNGLKFYKPGEIAKADEAPIRAAFERVSAAVNPHAVADTAESIAAAALEAYRARYLDAFAPDCLQGLTVGVYQQSSVARDVLVDILEALGAQTVSLGRAERFIPVDTEAHRPEDLELLRGWAAEGQLSAIVSTDGDADRPLVADGTGAVLRGDILGLLSAKYLGSSIVVTPVTSSGAVESSGVCGTVIRTRVGSPFVIEAMEIAHGNGAGSVIGFEANGGVLLGSAVTMARGVLPALPTRDAVLPILCALAGANGEGVSVRAYADTLGAGHALADRLKNVPTAASGAFVQRIASDDEYAGSLLADAGPIAERSLIDGARFVLEDGSTVHFRASGNAPELRVYVEATGEERARYLLDLGLEIAAGETMQR